MASKFYWESSIFNSFLVTDNSIYNKVDPDVHFFQVISLPLKLKKVLKTSLRMQFLIFMSVLEVRKRTLKSLKIFTMHWTSDLVSFASLKHRLMIVLINIPFIC